jgi:hypothetical protein
MYNAMETLVIAFPFHSNNKKKIGTEETTIIYSNKTTK